MRWSYALRTIFITSPTIWAMKAWEIAIFRRVGPPILVAVQPEERNVRRNAWTEDLVFFKGFDPDDAHPPFLRALEVAISVMKKEA